MRVQQDWSLDPGEHLSLFAVLTGNHASSILGEQRVLHLHAGDHRHDVFLYGTTQAAQTALGFARGLAQLIKTLDRDEVDDETRREIGRLGAEQLGHMAREDEAGLDRLAEAVKGERWPSVAEVAGEVHGGASCGYSGCTPADPCGACQTLAGAQGAGTQGGEAR